MSLIKEKLKDSKRIREEQEIKNKSYISDAEYFSDKTLSFSKISRYLNNPAILNEEYESNSNFTLGQLLHKALLESDTFNKRREFYISMLDSKSKETFIGIEKSFLKNKSCSSFVEDAKYTEKPIFFEIEDGEKTVNIKSKIDLFTKKGYLIDLKTSVMLDFNRGFAPLERMQENTILKIINKYRIDMQLAVYKRALESIGEEVKGVVILFLEKKFPFEIVCVQLSDNMLERGLNGDEWFEGFLNTAFEITYKPKKKRFKDLVMI